MNDVQERLIRLLNWGWRPDLHPHILLPGDLREDWQTVEFVSYIDGNRLGDAEPTGVGWVCDAKVYGGHAFDPAQAKKRFFIHGGVFRTPSLTLDYLETKVHEIDPEFEPTEGASERIATERRRDGR
jgi:hypothetical protein